MQKTVNGQQELAAALLRVSLGSMWIAHALLKIMVFTLPGTAQFFASQGLPGWLAYPIAVAELAGGAALLAGFHGRLVSLMLLPVLAGALFVHAGNGWVFTATGGGWEYPLFLMVMSLTHVLLGDGAYAVRRAPAMTQAA